MHSGKVLDIRLVGLFVRRGGIMNKWSVGDCVCARVKRVRETTMSERCKPSARALAEAC